ncbi:ROK family protein [Acidobacteria bacterium AH-259-G07]|nr:ROK family protein [Acidobacteria bacterium AH-259-G07]
MQYAIGVDIGGHKIRAALCNSRGDFMARQTAEIDPEATTTQTNVDILVCVIEAVLKKAGLSPRDLACIAVGVPGVTNTKEGVVVLCPNVPHWDGLPLKGALEKRLPVCLKLDNDVNMAAIGEHWKGAACGHAHFFFLGLGTGIGAGIFVDGRLYRGSHDGAGEIGYAVLHPGLRERRVGDWGWLESIASGAAIEKLGQDAARQHPDSLIHQMAGTPERVCTALVFEAARQGDLHAGHIVEEATDYLALAVVNITALLDPELIIFGGGVSRQGEGILRPVREKAQGFGIPIPPICQSKLEDEAQLYGAVYTALEPINTAL